MFGADVRDGALFHSGRAVLVVPQAPPADFGETVVVAWKDGVEAVRAVTAAAPFLAKAKRICLITVDEGDHEDKSLAAMADYLTLVGLTVELSKIVPKSDTVGEALLLKAASKPGALLVMGGLWPLALARMGLWRRHATRAPQRHGSRPDGALTGAGPDVV
ncbi:MAG: hypothetical protein WB662_19495 [Methyloceanibacter sp.]